MLTGPILLTSCPCDLSSSNTASGHVRFDVQLVETGGVRPERSVEVQRLHAGPSERVVEVRIPLRPELHDVQERLEDGLLLVVAAGRADRHERLAVAQHDARRQRVARAGPRPQLAGACLSSQNDSPRTLMAIPVLPRIDRGRNPRAARRAVEDVAVAIDHRDVRRVLDDAGGELGVRRGGCPGWPSAMLATQ